MKEKPEISIIIPIYDSYNHLYSLLKTIITERYKRYEVLVVDDGSKKIKPLDKIEYKKVKIFLMGKRKGPAYCRNYGAKKAKGKILLFLDSDVEIQKGLLDKVVFDFKDKTKIILQGRYTSEIDIKNIFSIYKNIYSDFKFNRVKKKEGFSVSSFCFAILKSDFIKLGGFDENYRYDMIAEDTEFGLRARNLGIMIINEESLRVKHNKEYSFYGFFKTEYFKIRSAIKLQIRYLIVKSLGKREIIISKNKAKNMVDIVVSFFLAPIVLLFFFLSFFFVSSILFFFVSIVLFILINHKLVRYFIKEGFLKTILFAAIHLLEMILVFITIPIAVTEYYMGKKY